MIIAFTGHRDKLAPVALLEALAAEFPGALWVHGGAVGFDSQVNDFAKARGIPCRVIPPDYKKFGSQAAPLIRDRAIVDQADMVVALYDGRGHGGTFYTLNYAKRRGKTVRVINPDKPLKLHTETPIQERLF